ncbi:hypothetical protein V5J35_004119 [Endozoicomonas sp. NE40]|uniref:Uncharacterized protein n=1 Tax=Endozoicomonas lisbonensis TaxID=3120522 RepID=A0ABV2SMD4_9GAMM
MKAGKFVISLSWLASIRNSSIGQRSPFDHCFWRFSFDDINETAARSSCS